MLKKSIEEKILSILNSYYKYKFISLKNIEEYFIDLPKNFKKRDVLKIIKSLKAGSHLTKKFWIIRGYSEEEAKQKISEIQSNYSKKAKEKYSPEERKEIFNIKNSLKRKHGDKWKIYYNKWLEKCRRNSPNNVQKYINEGYSEEEAKQKVKEFNSYASSKGWKNRENNKHKNRITTTSKEWFLNKFEDENEALLEYTKRQSTKSKIKNYSKEELIEYYKNIYKEKYVYKKPEKFYIQNTQKFFKFLVDLDEFVDIIKEYYEPKIIYTRVGIKYNVDEGILKSSYEIKFYNLLKKNNINFILEKRYPNSRKFCDFYIPELNEYIEIAGLAGNYEYDAIMNYKMIKFNAKIILPQDMEKFVNKLKERINQWNKLLSNHYLIKWKKNTD